MFQTNNGDWSSRPFLFQVEKSQCKTGRPGTKKFTQIGRRFGRAAMLLETAEVSKDETLYEILGGESLKQKKHIVFLGETKGRFEKVIGTNHKLQM